MKLNEFMDIWLNKYKKNTLKLKTYVIYHTIINGHIKPELGHYNLKDISALVLQEFITSKLEHGNIIDKSGLSHNTVLLILSILKQAFKLAYDLELIKQVPTKNISISKLVERKTDAFDENEQKILESYCLNNKKGNYIGIVLCLYTGIRIGELLSLTWDDIDFHNKILTISKNVSTIKINGKSTLHIDTPKTITSNRLIPIPKQLIQYLKKIKKNSKSKYIISTKNKSMVKTRSYQKTYQRILKRLKIKYRNFHTLRHTFATRSIEIGIDVKTVSEILGHKNATITLNRYTHSSLKHKTKMMNKLGENLSK